MGVSSKEEPAFGVEDDPTDPGVVPAEEFADEETPEIISAVSDAAYMDAEVAQKEEELRSSVLRTRVLGVMIDAGLALGWSMADTQALLRSVLARLGFNENTIVPAEPDPKK